MLGFPRGGFRGIPCDIFRMLGITLGALFRMLGVPRGGFRGIPCDIFRMPGVPHDAFRRISSYIGTSLCLSGLVFRLHGVQAFLLNGHAQAQVLFVVILHRRSSFSRRCRASYCKTPFAFPR